MFDILNLRRIDDLTWAVQDLTKTVKVLCLVFTGGTWEDLEKKCGLDVKPTNVSEIERAMREEETDLE